MEILSIESQGGQPFRYFRSKKDFNSQSNETKNLEKGFKDLAEGNTISEKEFNVRYSKNTRKKCIRNT